MDKSRIIERIRKLLAFDGSNATPGEVENAVRLAQQLMEQHAIESAELESAAPAGSTGPEYVRTPSDLGAKCALWESALAAAVRTAVPGVDCYRATTTRRTFDGTGDVRTVAVVYWYGPVDLVEVAQRLYEETRTVIAAMAVGAYGSIYKGEGRSYAEGFAAGLQRKATEQRRASEHRDAIGAIVLRREAQNQAWLMKAHGVKLGGGTRATGPNGRHYGSAYGAGSRDAASYGFTPGRASAKLAGGRRALPGR